MPAELTFTVLGRSQPAGSKRVMPIRRAGERISRVIDANPRSKPWQAVVAAAARDALPEDFELFQRPLSLTVEFYFQRPAGHFGTGKNAHLVKASAPRYPAVRPDVTKLLRGVEDALTGIVWRDDSLVVVQTARKRFGTPERCEVKIIEVTG